MKSLKSKLVSFNIFLMALLGVIIVTQALFQVHGNLLTQVSRKFDGSLEAQEAILRLWVAEKSRQISAQIDTAQEKDVGRFLKLGTKAGDFFATYVGYADGRSVFSDDWVAPADYIVTERDWYKLATKVGKPVLTPPYIDEASKKLTVTIAAPFPASGPLKGVIGGDVMIESLVKTLLSQRIGKTGYFFIIDKAGIVIAHPLADLTLKPLSTIAPSLTPQKLTEIAPKENVEDVEMSGKAMLLSLRAIPDTDWLIGAVAEKDEILAPLDTLMYSIFGMTFVIFLFAIPFSNWVLARMLRGLFLLKGAMVDISQGDGDLTLRLSSEGKDEIAETGRAFNRFIGKLNTLFVGLKLDANGVIQGVQEANSLVLKVAESSEQMSEVSATNATALKQMTFSISQIAENASSADSLTGSASRELADNSQRMQRLSQGMEHTAQSVRGLEAVLASLENRSGEISGITNIIREIADQTNLLALNAAIEAARAGESGRGFAVVADEVRKLAERTTQATTGITDMVNVIRNETKQAANDVNKTVASVDEGVGLTRDAAEHIQTIGQTMSDVVVKMGEIVQSTAEQRNATEKILSNSEMLFGDVQSTLKKTCDSLTLLADSVGKMENEFDRFKL